ncbi:histidine--tRNA ligase [bacterium]|nr:histidine--tRNA ligase [bacterium]
MNIKAPRGTKDILPEEAVSWQNIEKIALELFTSAGVKEIRTPIIEDTNLFERGVGDTTDIVNKEMYTFEKGDRSLTLRPENTAGVVRAYLEHGMFRISPPVKLWYKGPMFRYENPQAGRQRQFHQIGMEIFGEKKPTADAEAISLAVQFLNRLGLNDLTIEINSLGCDECRKKFREKLKFVLKPYLPQLCEDCQTRFEKNPLRILDCKNENCNKIFESISEQKDWNKIDLCPECLDHFNTLKDYLRALDIKYVENPNLVRGLDYYTRTVFEIKSFNLGSQNAVCGGGRYDNLVSLMGGDNTPAVGWAMGVERLNSLLPQKTEELLDYFVVSTDSKEAIKLVNLLRNKGKSAEFDFSGRKFTKQLEKASKVAKKAIILGEDEISNGYLTVKDLSTSEQIKTDINNL